jgi:hypothetical protein
MARRILITNLTNWSTRDLRRFVVQCANRCYDKDQLRVLRVTFKHGRNSYSACSGHARLNGTLMTVFLPPKTNFGEKTNYSPNKRDLALVIVHEMGHCLGLTHDDMRGSAKFREVGGYSEYYAWASNLPLTRIEPKTKTVLSPTDKAQKKLIHAQKMIKKWESKLKGAQTKIKTWSKKAKKYEKKVNNVVTSTNS